MNREELLRIFVLANEFKEGDLLVGGANDEKLCLEARQALGELSLGEISKITIVEDNISHELARILDTNLATDIAHLSVIKAKEILLSIGGSAWARHYRDGLTSEAIAAIVKISSDNELSTIAKSLYNPLSGDHITIGSRQHFGSRIQPNSPGDDPEEILFSILEGLSYGCGDVILGINPASDDLETIIRLEELLYQVVERLELPTRYCVLSDIVKQTSARASTQVDVGFQSLAGTSKALLGMVGLDIDGILDLAKGFNGLYFETGQGSAVTNGVAEGVDMVTLESRAYGAARYLQRKTNKWMIVNDVAGFIGPEVFRTPDQLRRACLEDVVMAKLHGIAMGLDVCATFHMGIDPFVLQQLTTSIVEQAAPAYLMAVAGNADPMLGYLTTSFREHPHLRHHCHRQISSVMRQRLVALGIMDEHNNITDQAKNVERLYALYTKAIGNRRSIEELCTEASRKIRSLRQRGFDLGYGHSEDYCAPAEIEARIESIYKHARQALYAEIDANVIADVLPHHLLVQTTAIDRDDYLAHPASGEMIRLEDEQLITKLYPERRPNIQLVISDGLNANAINENLRAIIPPLKGRLTETGYHIGKVDIVVRNGRVRAGYYIGVLLDTEIIIHLIGERPGTGINTLSAYLTYGRNIDGCSRWQTGLDHSCTTAVCGIHKQGKQPYVAADEIARYVKRMFEERCSGVALAASHRSKQN
ncbi:MAG: ethanolamine ammonia-lyase subunit EutB [Acidobacteriota bacterium]